MTMGAVGAGLAGIVAMAFVPLAEPGGLAEAAHRIVIRPPGPLSSERMQPASARSGRDPWAEWSVSAPPQPQPPCS